MKRIRKTGWATLAILLAVAGSQAPRLLRAGDHDGSRTPAQPATNADAAYAVAADICPGLSAAALATQAISTDPDQAKSAIDQLRKQGPAGLAALMTAYNPQITSHRNGTAVFGGGNDKTWPRITTALDGVAAQHDAYASGLYWYTDFPSAQAAARSSGKPILSLRLLGNLSDEYSCANSRFFRTVLYANSDVAKHLSEHFILHWQSVRPVPVITIDFGDGRKIRRTITGNSIHYVLTADGTVVDAIPGLYGPKAFLRELDEAEGELNQQQSASVTDRESILTRWHTNQVARIADAFEIDKSTLLNSLPPTPAQGFGGTPTADDAATRVVSKTAVEQPLLARTTPAHAAGVVLSSTRKDSVRNDEVTDTDWVRIAALHSTDALLDRSSLALMAVKAGPPDAAAAARITASKTGVERPLIRVVANFQRSIAEDTVRNEYLYHLQIHRWLADPANANLASDVNALNKRVYAELFLTPDSDPWLGLVPADTYTGLDGGGICH